MKKTIFTSIAIAYAFLSLAQESNLSFAQGAENSITWGNYSEDIPVGRNSYFVSNDSNNLFLITRGIDTYDPNTLKKIRYTYYLTNYMIAYFERINGFNITKYDKNTLEKIFTKDFRLSNYSTYKDYFFPENIFLKGDHIVVLYINYNDETRIISGRTIDTLGIMSDRVEIGYYEDSYSNASGKLFNIYSPESDEIITLLWEPEDNNTKINFTYRISDLEFEEYYKVNFTLPYKQKNFSLITYPMYRKGNLYFIGEVTKNEDDELGKGILFKYNIETEKVETLSLNGLNDNQVQTKVSMNFQNDSTISISGYYEDRNIAAKSKKALGKTDGTYYGIIDANKLEIKSFSNTGFNASAKKILLTDKEISKGRKPSLIGGANFIGYKKGGGLLYNAQYQNKKYERAKQLFFTGIDGDGNVLWNTYIPYNQQLKGKKRSWLHAGFDYHIIDGDLYFLHSTHKKNRLTFDNIPPEKHKTLKNEKDALPILSKVLSNGKIENTPLLTEEEQKEIMILPDVSYSTKNTIIFFSYDRKDGIQKKSRLGKITFHTKADEDTDDENDTENKETEE